MARCRIHCRLQPGQQAKQSVGARDTHCGTTTSGHPYHCHAPLQRRSLTVTLLHSTAAGLGCMRIRQACTSALHAEWRFTACSQYSANRPGCLPRCTTVSIASCGLSRRKCGSMCSTKSLQAGIGARLRGLEVRERSGAATAIAAVQRQDSAERSPRASAAAPKIAIMHQQLLQLPDASSRHFGAPAATTPLSTRLFDVDASGLCAGGVGGPQAMKARNRVQVLCG